MEAEFFGYRKGAFTGADRDRDGFFQAAAGGTLFLDEVAELPLAMQVKLLRAIQERRVRKVGAASEDPVDVRIVSATHQDLAALVSKGRFRQDLFYRLNVIEVRVPPLRDRLDDVPQLAARDPRADRRADGSAAGPAVPRGRRRASKLSLPGQRAGTREHPRARGGPGAGRPPDGGRPDAAGAGTRTFPPMRRPSARTSRSRPCRASASPRRQEDFALVDGVPSSLPSYLDALERDAIRCALERTRYNRTAAAQLLGITFRQLRYRMQRLAIK